MSKQRISEGVAHKLPADLGKALTDDKTALLKWEDITPLARNEWICWIELVRHRRKESSMSREQSQSLKKGCVALVAGWAAFIEEISL